MNSKLKVLVFPCGSENGIEIFQALKDVVNFELFGASGKDDHGVHLYKNYIGDVPYLQDINFPFFFRNLLLKYEIDIVFPTHDDVALVLAAPDAKWPAKIAVPGFRQAQICRSKKLTYDLLDEFGFCPQRPADIKKGEYPLFAKPDKGQGGKGAIILNNPGDLEKKNVDPENYVIAEFLPGDELTIDCFTDYKGILRFVGSRSRDRIWGGISMRSTKIENSAEILNMAGVISRKIGMNGLWYFQVKKSVGGEYKLLEVSIRTSGTMNLFRTVGVNFPLLTVYNLLEMEVDILALPISIEVDRSLKSRYRHNLHFNTVYIDFDDTITRLGVVNFEVMALIYNLRQQGKAIILITRHEGNINDALKQLAIHPDLFESIIQLGKDDEKYTFIDEHLNPVFIDNAYRERALVYKQKGIPVFDVDAIDLLIDWKS